MSKNRGLGNKKVKKKLDLDGLKFFSSSDLSASILTMTKNMLVEIFPIADRVAENALL